MYQRLIVSPFKPSTMKTIRFALTLTVSVLILGGLFLFSSGCKEKSDDTPTPSRVPYSNMQDDSTTSIHLTIPRIELSPLKSTEIKLYLSITDQAGNPFTEFNQYNFTIKQVCTGTTDTTIIGSITFNKLNNEGSHIAVASTLDYSGSMSSSNIQDMEDAVTYFINLKENNDYMEIIKFASTVQVMTDFTNDPDALIQGVLEPANVGTYTAFYDAVQQGIYDCDLFVNSRTGFMPAIIGFTDGGDNNSSISIDDLVSYAQGQQIPVYCLGFGDPNTTMMNYLANETGGRYYYTPDPTELQDLYALISGQLKNLYTVTWKYDKTGCDELTVVVVSSYTCKNGKFTTWASKQFFPLK